MLTDWDQLPPYLRTPEIRPYYQALARHKGELRAKRCMDVAVSALALAGLAPLLCAVAAAIKISDPAGPVLFRQTRITQNGRPFSICKFRTMAQGAENRGALVTGRNDSRVTPVGRVLRRYKLDELPQLWNVLAGDMTLVGTRPEVPRYVAGYTPEMRATLLLPAGITSAASLRFRHEEQFLSGAGSVSEKIYTKVLLPDKMQDNLEYLRHYSLRRDGDLLLKTALSVLPARSSLRPHPARSRR